MLEVHCLKSEACQNTALLAWHAAAGECLSDFRLPSWVKTNFIHVKVKSSKSNQRMSIKQAKLITNSHRRN